MEIRRKLTVVAAAALALAMLPAQAAQADRTSGAQPKYLDARLPIPVRVADLLGRMTLEEKIGQMTQAERLAVVDDPTRVATWNLGSVLSGGGSVPTPNTAEAWATMVNSYQAQALSTRLHIPMIYGVDAVHGHNNVYGATIFPHNVGLGSTRDPGLVQRIGAVTADEVRATGIPWDFAPCICVSRDERWGRSYESFGEDPALAVQMTTVIDGLQGTRPAQLADGDHVLATAKHFAGDGDTGYDYAKAAANVGKNWWEKAYTIDQGVTVTSRADFDRIDLPQFKVAVQKRDVGSVMPSFSSVDFTDDGVGNPVKMHANGDLINGTLKHDFGFDGFVVSDWEGIHQIPDPSAPGNGGLTAYKVATAVNAGIDMAMEPNSAPQFEELLLGEVNAGHVSQARIDDAVGRILTQKFKLGLFEHPYAATDRGDEVGSAAHRAVARQAAAESQVLLKNDHALPLSPKAKIYVAGSNADDLGHQAGGWTISWQGESGPAIPGTSILAGLREDAPNAQITYSADASAPTTGNDVGVVVVGESAYAEGYGDVGGPECGWCSPSQQVSKSLELSAADKAAIDKVCTELPKCVVLVVSGRPQLVTDRLGEIDGLVASWLPGSEGGGVADVLFGRRPFTGRLSVSWPAGAGQLPINVGDANYQPLFPFGWGLRTGHGGGGSPVDELVATVRDRAQAKVVAGHGAANWRSLIADADHAQLSGDPFRAILLLAQV